MQVPCTQGVSHAPQWSLLVLRSTQAPSPLQSTVPVGQTHAPAMQAPLQNAVQAGQKHAPSMQVAPVGQVVPQVPQCASLVAVLTQRVPVPLQTRKPCPVLHRQRPSRHLAPAQQAAVALHRWPMRRQAAADSSRPRAVAAARWTGWRGIRR